MRPAGLATVILVVVTVAAAALTLVEPPAVPPWAGLSTGWTLENIDNTGVSDPNPSAATAMDGTTWVLFSKGNGIRLARPTVTGSGCTNTGWTCEIIEQVPGRGYGEGSAMMIAPSGEAHATYSNNSGGFYSMMYAVRSVGGGWIHYRVASDYVPLDIAWDALGRPVIVYQDTNGIGLGMAHFGGGVGGPCNIAANWSCLEIDPGSGLTGYGASIHIDSDGTEHLAYKDFDVGAVRYAKSVGSGGNCGSGRYYCHSITQSIANRPMTILRNSTALLISYPDQFGLGLAKFAPTGGAGCLNAANWTCTIVSLADTSAGKGASSSMRVAGGDKLQIAYYNQENDTVEVASQDGGGGSTRCTEGTWHCHVVAATGYSVSLAMDSADNIHVFYLNSTGGTWALGHATTTQSVPESGTLAATIASTMTAVAAWSLLAVRNEVRHRTLRHH